MLHALCWEQPGGFFTLRPCRRPLARESFRLNQHSIDNIDIVLMVKSGIDEQSNEELTKQLTKLWRKINERCKPGAPKPPPFKKRPNKSAKSNKQT